MILLILTIFLSSLLSARRMRHFLYDVSHSVLSVPPAQYSMYFMHSPNAELFNGANHNFGIDESSIVGQALM